MDKIGIRQTSLEAYKAIKPKLGARQKEVFDVLDEAAKPLTDKELSEILDRPINTVTPRRNELVKKGLIVEAEKRLCTITGSKAIAWKINNGGFLHE